MSTKAQRQHRVARILTDEAVTSQGQLVDLLAEAGVMATLPGVIGTMMAGEAIKLITGAGTTLRGEMLIYDALYGESRKFTLKPRADCPICGGKGDTHDKSAAG